MRALKFRLLIACGCREAATGFNPAWFVPTSSYDFYDRLTSPFGSGCGPNYFNDSIAASESPAASTANLAILPMPKVFISYRRHDAGIAGRVYDRLTPVFGGRAVFMDVDSIDPGANFP